MSRLIVAAAFLASLGGPVAAQDSAAGALPLTVRPSAYDSPSSDARQRQDRLLKRMQEDEYLFRNICVQCGGGVNKPGANAPFEPADALRAARRS
jgi:hypothetical protein